MNVTRLPPNVPRLAAPPCLLLVALVWFSPLSVVAQGASAPASIAIVYDTSRTVAGSRDGRREAERGKHLFEALKNFVRQGHEMSEYFVVGFDTRPRVILDGSRDREEVLAALSKLASGPHEGATALFDACHLGAGKIAQGRYAKKAIIVISDGVDTASERTALDAQRALSQAGAVVYTVHIGRLTVNEVELYRIGTARLDKLASAAGGLSFRPKKAVEMEKAFATIAERLRD
jgi:Ca-activated chloride channel homolog